MKTAVQTACLTTTQLKPAINSKKLAWLGVSHCISPSRRYSALPCVAWWTSWNWYWHWDSTPTMACFITDICTKSSWKTSCLSLPCPGMATSVHRFSVPLLDGHGLTLRRQKGKLMMHCPLCFNMRVSPSSLLWMAIRNRPLASSTKNAETPAVIRRPQNLAPLGWMLLNGRFRN